MQNILSSTKASPTDLDPVYTVQDSCGHKIKFGQFAVIFIPTIFSMIIVVIKFCYLMS